MVLLQINLDGVIQTDTSIYSTIYQGTGELYVGSSGTYIRYNGDIAYAKYGEAEFKFDDNFGTGILKNTGTAGGDATLTDYIADDFWQTDYSGLKEVKNGYGSGDGSVYVQGDDSPIHNGTNIDFELLIKPDFAIDYESPFNKYTSSGNGEFIFFQYSSGSSRNMYLVLEDSSGTGVQTAIATNLQDNEWLKIKGNFDNGELTWTINEGAEQSSTLAINNIKTSSTAPIMLFNSLHVAYGVYSGEIAYAKFGTKTFDFTEQTGLKVGNADIVNYYDGFWQSANAKLVQSNCGKFDYNAYAAASSAQTHTSTHLEVDAKFRIDDYHSTGVVLVSKYTHTDTINKEFYIQVVNGIMYFWFSEGGSINEYVQSPNLLTLGKIHTLNVVFDNGVINYSVDGVAQTPLTLATYTSIFIGDAPLIIGSRIDKYDFDGLMFYLRVGDFEWNFADGAAGVLHDASGNENHAELTSYIAEDFWAERQNVYHYNILEGFDKYLGSDNAILRTPIGVSVSDGDYMQDGSIEYLEENPSVEITQNPLLNWTGAVIDDFTQYLSGTGSITEEAGGTRIVADGVSNALVYTADTVAIKANIEYKFYIKIPELVKGVVKVSAGNGVAFFPTAGVHVATLKSTVDSTASFRTSGDTDALVSEFYVWEEGVVPSLSPTNPAGKWHNGAETAIQFPELYQDIQDSVPITSMTKNARLEWVDGEIDNYTISTSGAGLVEETALGTRVYTTGANTANITTNVDIEAGEDYNYYIRCVDATAGNMALRIGGTYVPAIAAVNTYMGTITTIDTTNPLYTINAADVDVTINRLCIWKVGTIPPLFYDEFETDFNNKHQVFSNTEDKKKRSIAIYDTPLDKTELRKVYKCNDTNISMDENGDPILDENGDYIILT